MHSPSRLRESRLGDNGDAARLERDPKHSLSVRFGVFGMALDDDVGALCQLAQLLNRTAAQVLHHLGQRLQRTRIEADEAHLQAGRRLGIGWGRVGSGWLECLQAQGARIPPRAAR